MTYVTRKVKYVTPIRLEPNMSKTAGDAVYIATIANSLLWGSTVGYPSDSLTSCFSFLPAWLSGSVLVSINVLLYVGPG